MNFLKNHKWTILVIFTIFILCVVLFWGILLSQSLDEIAQVADEHQCGISKVGRGLIYGGEYSSAGAWPWLSALRHKHDKKFFCAGSLISIRHVLTAAHCISLKNTRRNLTSESFYVELGRYDLNDGSEQNVKEFSVRDIIVHSEWKKKGSNYHADITLIYLDTDVTFTDFIQPVCLPEFDSQVVLDVGTIVGWGRSKVSELKNDHENMPKEVKISAISNELCFLSQPRLAALSSLNTFCAGGNGYGACKGDSGGGFYVYAGKSFALRGIISSSLFTPSGECDVSKYAVYTDISKYINWIRMMIRETSGNRVDVKPIKVVLWNFEKLECYFAGTDEEYKCDVLLLNFNENNVRLTGTNGDHVAGKSNIDVTYFRAYSKATAFIPNGIGETFPNLKTFYVNRCELRYVERINFEHMENLQSLRLGYNKVENIPESTFWDLENLEDLDLGGNHVQFLHKNTLMYLKKLKTFYFFDNRLEYLDLELFKNNKELEVVSLNRNDLAVIAGHLSKVPFIKRMSLEENHCISQIYDAKNNGSFESVAHTIENFCRKKWVSNMEGTEIWFKRFGHIDNVTTPP